MNKHCYILDVNISSVCDVLQPVTSLAFPFPPSFLLSIADNLVDYQITKEVKFTAEHRDKLAAVQQAVNPHVAPVADSAVSNLQLRSTTHPPFSSPSNKVFFSA